MTVLIPFPADAQVITGDFDSGRALELLYGSYNPQGQFSEWQPDSDELQQFEFPSETPTLYTSVNLTEKFEQDGTERYLMLTETVPPDYTCHACPPAIGGTLFSKHGDGWRIDSSTHYINQYGEYGTGPTAELVQFVPGRYIVFLTPLYTGTFQEKSLVLVAEVGGTLKEILSIDSFAGQGETDGNAWEYNSQWQFIP